MGGLEGSLMRKCLRMRIIGNLSSNASNAILVFFCSMQQPLRPRPLECFYRCALLRERCCTVAESSALECGRNRNAMEALTQTEYPLWLVQFCSAVRKLLCRLLRAHLSWLP